jgi:hypothetical protein
VVDADLLGHVLQGHAVEPVLGEQIFGRVEDLLHRLGALLGLGGASPGFHVFGH